MTTHPDLDPGADDAMDRPLDPRSIRVTLAPASGGTDVPPLVLEPPQVHQPVVLANGQPLAVSLTRFGVERAILHRGDDGGSQTPVLLLPAAPAGGTVHGRVRREVVVDGWRVEVEVEPAVRSALRERARRGREEIAHSGPTEVHAIIPGVVVSVSVIAGDAVSAGQQFLVIEAMKMQNELRAPRGGTVERVAVAAGETIDVGDLLLVLV